MRNYNKQIKILITLLFFQGLLQTIGIPFFLIKLITEGLIIALFLKNLKSIKSISTINILLILYFVICIFSGIYNDNSLIDSVLYARYHIYAGIIFILSFSHKWSPSEVVSQLEFLKKILIIQVAYAFFELFILRDPQEEVVGTIFINGGEAATVIPLFGLSFLFVDYLYNRSTKRLFLSLSLLLIGFASLKRGVIFYFPLLLLIIYFKYSRIQKLPIIKSVWYSIFIIISGLILFIIGVSKNDSLKGDGLLDGLSTSTSYAAEYSNAKSHDGYFIGRTSSSLQVLLKTGSNGIKDFIGFGPKTLMGNSGDFFFYKIDYGIVGWSKEVISVGWLGMLIYLMFYYAIFRKIKSYKEIYSSSSYRGVYLSISAFYLVFLLSFFTYSPIFSQSGVVSFYFMIFSGILLNYIKQLKNARS